MTIERFVGGQCDGFLERLKCFWNAGADVILNCNGSNVSCDIVQGSRVRRVVRKSFFPLSQGALPIIYMLQETPVGDASLCMFRMIFQKRQVHLANVVEAFSDAECKELSITAADSLHLSAFLDPASDVRNRSVVGN